MKRRILAVLVLHLAFFSSRGQVDSAAIDVYTNEIYTYVFEKYIWGLQQPNLRNEKTTVVIREHPKFLSEVKDYMEDRIRKDYKRIQGETFDGFKEKISAPVCFRNLNIPDFYIYVFDEESFPTWIELEENYKNWNRKYIEFTPISYNSDFDQAMLYFGYDDGAEGDGVVLIFERKRKKWRLKGRIGLWG